MDDTPEVSHMTANQHIAAAIDIATRHRATAINRANDPLSGATDEERSELNAAARDYSIAITALEDGNTRYNSARYHERGIWKRADPDLD